jgi:hypothetical protein
MTINLILQNCHTKKRKKIVTLAEYDMAPVFQYDFDRRTTNLYENTYSATSNMLSGMRPFHPFLLTSWARLQFRSYCQVQEI